MSYDAIEEKIWKFVHLSVEAEILLQRSGGTFRVTAKLYNVFLDSAEMERLF
jgi:hypothetical protein